MANIRPKDLPAASSVTGTDVFVLDTGAEVKKATPGLIVDAAIPLASQAEAEAGVDNTKRMTPLRTKQAFEAREGQFVRRQPNVFDVEIYGVVTGPITGDTAANLTRAQANREAVEDAVIAMKAAIAGGMTGCELHLPSQDWMITTAPFAGTSPPSAGVSAVGGGHYQGSGTAPLSAGWSCHGIVIDSVDGWTLHGGGGTILRIENDPYNTESAVDQFNSTIFISRCSDFILTGRLIGKGYQSDAGAVAGSFIDISYGCEDFDLSKAFIRSSEHNNAVVIGMNRASGYSSAVTGYDISQPCIGYAVGRVRARNGEHAVLVNVADEGDIESIIHRPKPFYYGGVLQTPYIQRCLYMLACGRIHVGSVQSYGAHKAAVLPAVYDSRRAYKDLDCTIDEVFVQAPLGQDSDFYIGVNPNDQCTDPAYLRTISITIGSLTTRGVKSGVDMTSVADAAMATTKTLRRLHIGHVDIQATKVGIGIDPYGQCSDIVIGNGTITVTADTDYSADAEPVTGLFINSTAAAALGASATDFITDVRIGQVLVNSGNRAVQIGMVDGLTIEGMVANYVAEGVPGAVTTPFVINYSKNYGEMSYRTNDGSVAGQSDALQIAPSPVRGVYRRSGTLADPGALAAGASFTSNLTLVGAKVGMAGVVTLSTTELGMTATAAITTNDQVALTITNTSSSSKSPGTIDYVLLVFSTLASGT